MGRSGGRYEINGGKKTLKERTKPAKPVDGKKTKLELHQAAQKAAEKKTTGKGE